MSFCGVANISLTNEDKVTESFITERHTEKGSIKKPATVSKHTNTKRSDATKHNNSPATVKPTAASSTTKRKMIAYMEKYSKKRSDAANATIPAYTHDAAASTFTAQPTTARRNRKHEPLTTAPIDGLRQKIFAYSTAYPEITAIPEGLARMLVHEAVNWYSKIIADADAWSELVLLPTLTQSTPTASSMKLSMIAYTVRYSGLKAAGKLTHVDA